jgi:3-oxoacyl-[acyl-carrier protein] reductase
MDLRIEGRVALVTGASQGIGRAIAAELAAEGARVAITSRSADRARAVAAEIGAAAGFAYDSGDAGAAGPLAGAVAEALGGPVEILVTNTGGPPANADPLAFTREQWETAYRQLVLGPIELIEQVVPAMRAARWGRIVNVSSNTVREPVGNLMLSNANRAATAAAFKTLARELAPDGITFNTLLTGRIATERLAELYGSMEHAETVARTEVPAGRLGTVEEMSAVACFLCSERASFVTGTAIRVDGGMTRSV